VGGKAKAGGAVVHPPGIIRPGDMPSIAFCGLQKQGVGLHQTSPLGMPGMLHMRTFIPSLELSRSRFQLSFRMLLTLMRPSADSLARVSPALTVYR